MGCKIEHAPLIGITVAERQREGVASKRRVLGWSCLILAKMDTRILLGRDIQCSKRDGRLLRLRTIQFNETHTREVGFRERTLRPRGSWLLFGFGRFLFNAPLDRALPVPRLCVRSLARFHACSLAAWPSCVCLLDF